MDRDHQNDQLDRIYARKAAVLAWIGTPAAYFGAMYYFRNTGPSSSRFVSE